MLRLNAVTQKHGNVWQALQSHQSKHGPHFTSSSPIYSRIPSNATKANYTHKVQHYAENHQSIRLDTPMKEAKKATASMPPVHCLGALKMPQ